MVSKIRVMVPTVDILSLLRQAYLQRIIGEREIGKARGNCKMWNAKCKMHNIVRIEGHDAGSRPIARSEPSCLTRTLLLNRLPCRKPTFSRVHPTWHDYSYCRCCYGHLTCLGRRFALPHLRPDELLRTPRPKTPWGFFMNPLRKTLS